MSSAHVHEKPKYPVLVALTGASGAIYGLRLIERLLAEGQRVNVVITRAAQDVITHEVGLELREENADLQARLDAHFPNAGGRLKYLRRDDWFCPEVSGSSGNRPMVICPCSMGTLAAIANGLSDNVIERAADVALKERRKLILVPRETPLSEIHLENMLKLTRMGAVMMPAMPGFYHGVQSVDDMVDFIVARIMDHLGVPMRQTPRWGG
ncbi:UbiX family flavin prenyltransferase [Magnetococcus sp. PR-3]|uniref:UbiX family flavin prenyltransferase n=1 Tax=Magnetococcus sp. PR-3 TaxID=3120355 RepID=UPI002FCE5E89